MNQDEFIKQMEDCPQKRYLLSVKQKEKEALERQEKFKKIFEIRRILKEVGDISDNIIFKIIEDFNDLTPCILKATEFIEMKEESGDYKDERIYNLVKNNKSLEKHQIIAEFKKYSNLDFKECIEWCKMGNYHFKTIKKLFLNMQI